jgi:hypothetical protein
MVFDKKKVAKFLSSFSHVDMSKSLRSFKFHSTPFAVGRERYYLIFMGNKGIERQSYIEYYQLF